MWEKFRALFESRRFLAAVGGVMVLIMEPFGVDEQTAQSIVNIVIAWIIGDSLSKTRTLEQQGAIDAASLKSRK